MRLEGGLQDDQDPGMGFWVKPTCLGRCLICEKGGNGSNLAYAVLLSEIDALGSRGVLEL